MEATEGMSRHVIVMGTMISTCGRPQADIEILDLVPGHLRAGRDVVNRVLLGAEIAPCMETIVETLQVVMDVETTAVRGEVEAQETIIASEARLQIVFVEVPVPIVKNKLCRLQVLNG